jgi:hypothetical protein
MIRRLLSLSLLPVLFAACTDETPSLPDAAVTSPDAGAADAGAAEAGSPDGTAPQSLGDAGADAGPTGPQGLVVLHSDYKTTLVSLVDPATNAVIKDDCIDSGSKTPTLTASLSGDVVAPTQAQPTKDVVLIDRLNSTLTWVAPSTCAVTRQVNVGEGKMANPQDVLPVSDKKVYVPRYSADTSDLLVLDPSTGTITGHIDLKGQAPSMTVLANPSRGVVTNGKAYVVLTALSADSKTGAPGRVVVVDPATDAVTGSIDLTLKNCGSIAALDKALVVGCGGVFGDPNQMMDSGVALIDLSATPPTVKVVAAKDFGRALSPFDVGAVSPSLAFAITGGDFSNTPPDQLWAFDFAGGAPRKILDGKAAFTLSGLQVDAARKKLFIADGDMKTPKLHVLDLSTPASITVQSSVTTAAGGLPPRYTAWY